MTEEEESNSFEVRLCFFFLPLLLLLKLHSSSDFASIARNNSFYDTTTLRVEVYVGL